MSAVATDVNGNEQQPLLKTSTETKLNSDIRIHWIENKLRSALADEFDAADTHGTNDLFQQCMGRNGGTGLQKLKQFLDDSLAETALIFYVDKAGLRDEQLDPTHRTHLQLAIANHLFLLKQSFL